MFANRTSLTVLLAAVLGVAGLRPAHATSDGHYQDSLIGERAAGMGGAFTALGDEATGAYYNPAGIVVDASTLFQVSMSAYKLRAKRVAVLDLCGTQVFEDDSGFFGFPAALGFVKLLQTGSVRHAVGLMLTIPTMDKVSQAALLQGVQCEAMQIDSGNAKLLVDRVFHGGLTYAVQPWPWLRLGATFGLAVRSASETVLGMFVLNNSGAPTYPALDLLNLDVTLWHVFAQWGVIVEPLGGLRLGLSVTSSYLALNDGGRLDRIESSTDPADWLSTTSQHIDDAVFRWKVPWRLALGVAYRRSPALTLAADVTIHLAVEPYGVIQHADEIILALERKPVVNFNLGAEVYAGAAVVLRGGLFTNLSSQPSPESATSMSADKVHYVGAATGVSYVSSSRSTLGLTVQGQIGFGEAAHLAVQSLGGQLQAASTVAKVRAYSLIIGLGGSFDLR